MTTPESKSTQNPLNAHSNDSKILSPEGDNSTDTMEMQRLREHYFKTHYDQMTGIRIAGTLGGFFLLVLLTLCYKSKCKKHSRPGSPIPFSHPLTEDHVAMLDPILNNQIYPYNPLLYDPHHQFFGRQVYPGMVNSPAVLLTAANSSSSASSSSPGPEDMELDHGTNSYSYLQPVSPQKQNIDIHVILPTPTISPSGSEHFTPQRPGREDRSCSLGSNNSPLGGFNPIYYMENLKYVDDTSSENIPTCEEIDQDARSIGSDSVFAAFEQNFDHVAPRRVSSVSGSGSGCGPPEDELRITLTQADVHHRDSFCSELESINDYMESRRRRSSSTQTTFSDLQQCLSLSGGCSPRVSLRDSARRGGSWLGQGHGEGSRGGCLLGQGHGEGSRGGSWQGQGEGSRGGWQQGSITNNTPTLLTVHAPNNRVNYPRKRSFDASVRKTPSFHCDEPNSCSTNN